MSWFAKDRKVTIAVDRPRYLIPRALDTGSLLGDKDGEPHLLVYTREIWLVTRFDGTVVRSFRDRNMMVSQLHADGWTMLPPGTKVTLTVEE